MSDQKPETPAATAVPPADGAIVSEPAAVLQPVHPQPTTIESLQQSLEDHKAVVQKNHHVLILIICGVGLLVVLAWTAYHKLVVEPRIAQGIALEQSAQKTLDDTQVLTKVLLDSVASQNPKLAKTVTAKLQELGFQAEGTK